MDRMSCSQCEGIAKGFNEAEARKRLRRFRRRGPDRSTRLLIDELQGALGSDAAGPRELLDVGGGVGAIHHTLLESGVTRAVHVDASPAYLSMARQEAGRRGHGALVEFVSGDFVEMAGRLAAADVVTLDRVICCYHDMERLVTASAAKARRYYGAVYPRGVWWMRSAFRGVNVLLRRKRSGFRVFVHDPPAIDAVLRAAGLQRTRLRRTVGWEIVLYERVAAAPGPA
jgi:magnesium-protoporphyrin O-methyltransferase